MEAASMSEPSPAAKDTTKRKDGPPPMKPHEIRTRRLVVFSFWAVVIFLGLPIWWWTTTVYRARLPLHEMTAWTEGKVCRPTFPLRVGVEMAEMGATEAQHLIKTTQHALDDLNDFSAHHLRLVLLATAVGNGSAGNPTPSDTETGTARDGLEQGFKLVEDDVALIVRLKQTTASPIPTSRLHTYSPLLDIFYSANQIPTGSTLIASPLASQIAKELQDIFAEEQATLAYLLNSSMWGSPHSKTLSPDMTASLAKGSTRSFKYTPTYHLTFSLLAPANTPSDWEIEEALQQHIKPLLHALSSISNFTIDTQVHMYATFAPSMPAPEYNEEQNLWTLSTDDLSGFINAAEWPLNPSIGAGPTVNFIIYVPASHQRPLVIRETGANNWLVPQWGGIQIFNPTDSQDARVLTRAHLDPAMQIVTAQLLSLLGLPQSPKSLPIRLSTLTRLHAASLIFSASSTLGALARLTKSLKSIAIPNSVAASVDMTLKHLHEACNSLRDGKFHSALQNAIIAEAEAERAFFERSMVGQLYFPDEHKIAVYMPLLGPVAVPLVTSALKEFKRWRTSRIGAAHKP